MPFKNKEDRKLSNKKYYESNKEKRQKDGRRYYQTVIKPSKDSDLELPIYYTSKKCDQCQGMLELSRYKTCKACKPNLGKDLESSYLSIRESLDFRISELSLLAGG